VRKLSVITVALVAALALAGCGAEARSPQVDDRSGAGDRPETVIVYRDNDDSGGRSGDTAAANQDDTSNRGRDNPQDAGAQGDGSIIVEDDNQDGTDGLDADDNMQSGQQLPDDFPIPVPDEYQVEAVGEAGNETAVVLRVPSGEDAYNYYRQALADAGFRVVDEGRNQGGFFDAELEFSNNELEGNIDFDGDRVEIDIELY
jgi:hypothetical protein